MSTSQFKRMHLYNNRIDYYMKLKPVGLLTKKGKERRAFCDFSTYFF